ncbi:hypothetical protein DKX38_007158 [Salix brachista]|uniref:Uncharacterized protein n=1 Tax=Salix brachista TaxID=2182728 RepID=A0A5N5MMF9_9ROSI|nr:hypothetical protein DKX38_007158 [Salix brachista]
MHCRDETKLIEEIASDIQRKLHHAPSTSIDAKGLVGMQSRVKHIESLLSFGSTGRKIVVQENADPRERSRLWEADDVSRVLTTQGTGKVESISLNLSETTEINLSPAAFEGMYNLRLLQFYNPPFLMGSVRINLPQGLHFLSNELRILYWCNFPLKSLPSNFCPEKLVVLEMPWSQLEQLWNDYQPLKNLKLMNLHASSKLILIDSDFSKVPNLEVLNLGQCRYCMGRGLISKCSEHCTKSYDYKSLCTLPSSIGFLLSQLVILNLSCRGGLTFLPDSIGELKSLVELNLQNCSKLASLPESIGELTCLVRLNLSYCSELACLPESIGELKSLVELNLDSCSELASLPDSIGKLKYLVKLNLEYVSELSSLPDSIGELKYLAKLNLSGCSKLKSLPDSIGKLKCLVKLDLSSCSKLSSLPYSIGELKYLAKLNLSSCSKLKSLPDSIGKLKCLVELYLSSCTEISSLPDSIGELKCLAKLILCCCSKLKSLPSSIYGLESSQWLDLGNCYKMNGFPILNLRRSEVEEIASTTNRLDCPQFLNLGASGVSEIPGSIGSLVSLRDLRLSCDDFERIPANIMQLPMLIELNLNGCRSLQHLPQLPSSLQVLIASDCISLTSVEGIFMQGEEDYEAASQEFDFCNCLQLDQNSLTKIIGDARLRILRMTTSLFNQQYFGEPIRVRLCVPGSEVPEWFTYKNTGGPKVKIKLPAHWHRANTTDQLFGFTLCAVVSFVSCQKYYDFDIKCECHLITEDGTQSDLSFHYYKIDEVNGWSSWKREHVFIWSIHSHIFFKEASFHFKLLGEITADAVVQSGVHPLFVQDYIDEPEQPHTEIDGKCLTNSSI